ncbi:RHS repeat-associated core domain-containing protein [Leifsonia sp. NPDC080035]|uniref:RHS repeat-associated core domain-containing protein n=1 Tax=Leifsonia sp. NPDC080035 TaxID=3143936 RepID=A0AAU7G5G0_9MICO
MDCTDILQLSGSYDAAGNRTGRTRTGSTGGNFAGVGTRYAYNVTGQTTSVSRDGRATSYAYDGLGRQASRTDTTAYGTETVRNSYDGTALSQSTSSTQGTTTLVRDAAGSLAEHVSDTGEATWDLLDGLASTVAGGTGASITQLASYEDWGAQIFETGGWDAPENYTGHAHDPTQGLVHTYARTYDPATGTWTSPDTWAGLLTQPRSLARYQYVHDNPTTYLDPDGHVCAARNVTDALPLGCGATQTPQTTRPVPPNIPGPVPVFDDNGAPIVYGDGPNDKSDTTVRHEDFISVALAKLPSATSDFPPMDWNGVFGLVVTTLAGILNVGVGMLISLEIVLYKQLMWVTDVVYQLYLDQWRRAGAWVKDNISRPIGEAACAWATGWLGGMGVPASC